MLRAFRGFTGDDHDPHRARRRQIRRGETVALDRFARGARFRDMILPYPRAFPLLMPAKDRSKTGPCSIFC